MEAESIQLVQYVVGYLESIIEPQESGEQITVVEHVYDFTEDLGTFMGRKVYVFLMEYLTNEPLTRRESTYDVRIGVVITRRYSSPSTPTKAAPVAWMNEEIKFVENNIFSPLEQNVMHNVPVNSGETVQYWPAEAAVTLAYDIIKLSQHKTFWSECEFVFRKVRA